MTKETLNKALDISNDLSMLKEIRTVQKSNHWIGFMWSMKSNNSPSCFQSEIMQTAFAEFVKENIDRLTAEFEKI